MNNGSGFKHSSKCASIHNSTDLQTVAAKSLIDNRFLQHALKRHTQLGNLTSDSLRVVPMQCNTSAMCSASGDSESQIRPTLTGKEKKTNQSINQIIMQSINQIIMQSINQIIMQSINQIIMQSINQIIMRSIDQIIMQSIDQIIMQSLNQIIMQSINQIIMQSTNQITMQSINQIIMQSINQIIMQSINQIIMQSINQIIMQSINLSLTPVINQATNFNQTMKLPISGQFKRRRCT